MVMDMTTLQELSNNISDHVEVQLITRQGIEGDDCQVFVVGRRPQRCHRPAHEPSIRYIIPLKALRDEGLWVDALVRHRRRERRAAMVRRREYCSSVVGFLGEPTEG